MLKNLEEYPKSKIFKFFLLLQTMISSNLIEVIQDFNLHLSGFSYFITKLFGVKKKMVATNELGMQRLKKIVEKETTLTKN